MSESIGGLPFLSKYDMHIEVSSYVGTGSSHSIEYSGGCFLMLIVSIIGERTSGSTANTRSTIAIVTDAGAFGIYGSNQVSAGKTGTNNLADGLYLEGLVGNFSYGKYGCKLHLPSTSQASYNISNVANALYWCYRFTRPGINS